MVVHSRQVLALVDEHSQAIRLLNLNLPSLGLPIAFLQCPTIQFPQKVLLLLLKIHANDEIETHLYYVFHVAEREFE